MAKPKKNDDRRAVVEQMRREQQRAEKRRSHAIIGAFVAVGLIIVGMGAYPVIMDSRKDSKLKGTDLAALGAKASAAGCDKVQTSTAKGMNDHQPEGKRLLYEDAPPAAGYHYPTWAPLSRKFYTVKDRPDVPYIVHNLEHGYNVLWYDETIANDKKQLAVVEDIAAKFPGTDFENKFIAAPWTSEDGGEFPEGKHVALTHWSMGGTNGNPKGQLGITQYCAEPSGEAVARFAEDYPYTDSPEPNAA